MNFILEFLGCDISVSVANIGPALFLGEATLSGLEAFLATSLDALLIPLTPRVHLRFVQREFLDEPFDFSVIPGPEAIIEVRHRKDEELLADPTTVTGDKFVALISTITAYIAAPLGEGKEFFVALVEEERGFGRALQASNIKTVMGNILGNEPKLRISDWKRDGAETELFPLKRGEPWDHDKAGAAESVETSRPTPGTGEVPTELRDAERMTHRDRRVLSLINVDLWNKAKWKGTGYITSENSAELPFLLLMFDNREAAVDIFAGWRDSLGPEDANEQLRVSIVTGVERKNPSAYRVVVSSNVHSSTLESAQQVLIVSRINAMYPESSENVDRFLADYQRKKRYILAPAQPGPDGIQGWSPKLGCPSAKSMCARHGRSESTTLTGSQSRRKMT